MDLIVTEKDNAARRIAEILSDGGADVDRRGDVAVYRWGDRACVGLSGHVVGVDFPPEYSDWRDVEPVELIDAPVEKRATQEGIVNTLQSLAGEADRVTIATDYDREGELIGKEAYELVRAVDEDVPIDRVRFSSITQTEVRSAFADPDDIDFELAAAGEARQIIDLVWGAALTRFLSLSSRQLGEDFISVGRVQTPTLKLLVDREREIQAFDPEDYWELFADLAKAEDDDAEATFESQYFYLDEDDTEAERVWDEEAAEAVEQVLAADSAAATVEDINRRTRTDDPPAPFNTTAFIRAAGAIGYGAQRAMSIAEDLYTAGYMTYPRTDNTVYPDDLDPEQLVSAYEGHPTLGEDAEALLEAGLEDPTEGDDETTDHPPIHPTGEWPDRGELSDDEWEVFELVVRRFFATVAEPARWEHLRVTASVSADDALANPAEMLPDGGNEIRLKANGKRLLEAGYHDVYPYFSTSENYVPDVTEGEELPVDDSRLEAKETQPPRRYGQSRLIETMEDLGVGTKCLTADTPVLHRDDAGDFVRTPIDDLHERGTTLVADGDTDVAITEDGPSTLSYHEPSEQIRERRQTLVSERPLDANERVLNIVSNSGSFSVTDDHRLYLNTENGVDVRPAGDVSPGDELLAARPTWRVENDTNEVVATWKEFARSCDKDSKLYGVDCGSDLSEYRGANDVTQYELASQLDCERTALSDYENDKRDVQVWILGDLGIRPQELHGLNYDATFENPFPLYWSPQLTRVLGSLLGDGSLHVNDEENVVDVRYHNTDPRLVDRFAADVESIFGFEPYVSRRSGREEHHKDKYQVNVPSAIGRILRFVLDSSRSDELSDIPEVLEPVFVGALFDDEGHISTDRKAFIANTDHQLLEAVAEMLHRRDIGTTLNRNQHKLYVRGRQNLERFLDVIPIAADEKFYRGLESLRQYDVTRHKAEILRFAAHEPKNSAEIAEELGITQGRASDLIRTLRSNGYLEKRIEGSNRSDDGLRTIEYRATGYEDSIYAVLHGIPFSTTVLDVKERDYNGHVYDLTVDEEAPNFTVQGGVVVHNSTRHNTIEKLYDRGYIEGDPPRPTQLAMAVVEAAEEYADTVVSEEMTAELEGDMTAIAQGEIDLEDVTEESREMLETVFEALVESREEIGEHLRDSLKADKALGECPDCGEDLLLRESRYGGSFVGCDGYPDCEYTLPLPDTGEPLLLEERCEDHGLLHVKMLAGRSTFVHGCPLCRKEEAGEGEILGACPECGTAHDGELAIKTLENGSRLVGCTRYPDCDYSLPLPRNGEIEVTDESCEQHGLPELVVKDDEDDDEPWELGCPICNYRDYQARESESGSDLEALEGVGSATAQKLMDAGVESIDDLIEADPEHVAADVDGVSADRLREWKAKA